VTTDREIVEIVRESGPLTGADILRLTGEDGLALWRTCKRSQDLVIQTVGTRYLRLDRRVDGYARLSPSILREFLTYSLVGLSTERDAIEQRAREVMAHIEGVSRSKIALAYSVVSGLSNRLASEVSLEEWACFIIAGDIVYSMAHDVDRPERSTGKLVRGSDMDVVVIVEDDCREGLLKRIDDALFEEKYRLLITPHIREEIDYVVKNLSRVKEQLGFDTFKHMVACKIMQEGTFLAGSEYLFFRIKSLLREHGVFTKLTDLEKRARAFRDEAEAYLLREEPGRIKDESMYLFYPAEESEEFE
jgi:hypothetical protein